MQMMNGAEGFIDSISSGSMSPVLDESNNIKKLKVDLTQFMNKQWKCWNNQIE